MDNETFEKVFGPLIRAADQITKIVAEAGKDKDVSEQEVYDHLKDAIRTIKSACEKQQKTSGCSKCPMRDAFYCGPITEVPCAFKGKAPQDWELEDETWPPTILKQ